VERAPVLEILLKGINMEVHRGKLAAMVGTVGSGKSSLLSRIMGEMDKVSGKVSLCYFLCKTDILVYQLCYLLIHLIQHSSYFSRIIYAKFFRKNARVLRVYFVTLAKLGANLVQSEMSQLRNTVLMKPWAVTEVSAGKTAD
jgi:ABC-type cobalamin/Fe3+-siderophores transport system ATPase subunit